MRGKEKEEYVPIVIGVQMEGPKVNTLQIQYRGEIFARGAVVVEVPAVGAGAVVEVAVTAESDEVVRVEAFDVLAYLVGPCG